MAKDEKNDGEAKPKKSMKLVIIIAAAVFLLVVVGGAAAFFLMKKGGDEGEEGEEAAAQTAKPKTPPVYIALDTFTVNLVPETTEQYLQIGISLEAREQATADQVKIYTPRLRHEIMDILASKKASEISTRDGKKALAEELRTAANGIVDTSSGKAKKPGTEPIQAVLFTSFIVQ